MVAREPGLTVKTQQQGYPAPHALDDVPTVAVALRLCWRRRAGVLLALVPTAAICAAVFVVFGPGVLHGLRVEVLLVAIGLLKFAWEPVALSYTLGTQEYRPELAFVAWRRALQKLWAPSIPIFVIGIMDARVSILPFILSPLSFVILAAALFAAPVIAFEDVALGEVVGRVRRFTEFVLQEANAVRPLVGLLVAGFVLLTLYALVFLAGALYLGLMVLMSDSEDAAFLRWWLPVVFGIGPAVLTLWTTWTLAWLTLLYGAFRRADDRAAAAGTWSK